MNTSKVLRVTNVRIEALGGGESIRIEVEGEVRTSGWTNPRLLPVDTHSFVPDGISEFDFVADPPTGPFEEVISPVSVEQVIENVDGNVKGVRIRAESNEEVDRLGG